MGACWKLIGDLGGFFDACRTQSEGCLEQNHHFGKKLTAVFGKIIQHATKLTLNLIPKFILGFSSNSQGGVAFVRLFMSNGEEF